MATLDVSDVLADPLFADSLTVYRRKVTIGDDGVATRTERAIAISAVVTAGKGDVVSRSPDGGRVVGSITVTTAFRLQAGAAGGQYEPDELVWQGDRYTVAAVSDYSNFGAGYVSAECDVKPVQPT